MWRVSRLIAAVVLSFPAAGVTQSRRAGTLNMIAWEGYTQPQWVKPFEKQSGCKVNAQVRRLVGRDGDADALRRRRPVRHGLGLRRREPAPDLRRRRSGRRSERRSRTSRTSCKTFQSPPNNTVDGKHYGISLQWGPNTLLYNTKKVTPAPTLVGCDLQPEVQGPGHRSRQPDPDRGCGALPDEDEAGARDHRSVRAERRPSSTPAIALLKNAEAADQEVLGARLGRDRPVQERQSLRASPPLATPRHVSRPLSEQARASASQPDTPLEPSRRT